MAHTHRTKVGKQTLFFLGFCFLLTAQLLAAPVTRETTKNVGLNWMWKHRVMRAAPDQRPQILAKGRISKIVEQIELRREGTVVGHIIRTAPKGFVLVAPDDLMKPILAYSLNNDFPTENLPPALEDWLAEMKDCVRYIRALPSFKANSKLVIQWEELKQDSTHFDESLSLDLPLGQLEDWQIGPLLTTEWGQGGPYNRHCPILTAVEEDFQDFTDFKGVWFTGDANEWKIEGLFDKVARSGAIDDNQISFVAVDVSVAEAGYVRFKRKVSSQQDHDFLKFCIGNVGNDVNLWSGELGWEWTQEYVQEGDQTLIWVYTKDGSISIPDDCAWIDEVQFPKLRGLAGCVAVAMGQIMKYHDYPPTGFQDTRYDWQNMPDSLCFDSTPEQIDAIGTLLYHCGVTVGMNYGYDGSGADHVKVSPAFKNYFYYDASDVLYKDSYSPEDWLNMMKQEVNADRPVYYGFKRDSATSRQSTGKVGHAVVLDGYDSDDFVHFNFGWEGDDGDGFYQIYPVIDVNHHGQWNRNHRAIIGIAPKYPPNPDVNGDGFVNFKDFAILAQQWLKTCSGPNLCEGADLDWSGKVDFQDLNTLAEHWLEPSSAFPRVFQPPTVVPGLEGYTLRASDITQDGSLMLLTIWDGAHRLYYTTWNPASEMWNAPQDMGFNNWDGMASLSPDEGTMYYSNHGVLYKATGSPPASPPGTLISQPTGTERPYFNGDRLYFHRGPENHDIWYCEYNSGSGEFGPDLLLSEISTSNWNEVHPYITPNGQTLLFSTNWPDGYNGLDNYGGWDIYKASWNGLQWVDLTNLGSQINTVGDETLPFYCPCTTTLYFTRDGTLMQAVPERAGSVAYWPFDEGSGNVVTMLQELTTTLGFE